MKFRYNYVLVYEWYISDDGPTNMDLLRTPFTWNREKIGDYVRSSYGRNARFDIITNELTTAKEAIRP